MARRKISEMQAIVRKRYEGQLKSIEPLSDLARKLLSQEGFLDLFLEVRMLYPTYEDAYEMLEEQHECIIGARMYPNTTCSGEYFCGGKRKNAHRSERYNHCE